MIKEETISDENPFWISFSDLMAGLLLVFILLLSVALLAIQEKAEERLDIKQEIILLLLKEFQDKYPVEINTETGTITVSEGILFDFNKFELKNEGKAFLKEFIPKYSEILFDNPKIRQEIASVIVEGHTDRVGSYNVNMEFSLQRALSVVKYIFSNGFEDFEYKYVLRKKLTANGRSFMDYKENLISSKSRRVEFKFRLKDVDLFVPDQDSLNTSLKDESQ
ncbi:MAG: OmpA family protein [Candidatus Heimdallarchaeaceae archaeon]